MEVLVAIFIFVVILGVVMVDYGRSKKVEELRLTAFDIEDSIRFVRNMALAGQKINNQVPTNGYGILINKPTNSYLIYGDSGDLGFDSNDSQYLETNLPTNIVIDVLSCYGEDLGTISDLFDIRFSAPRASMEIYGTLEVMGPGDEIVYGNDYEFCYINIRNSNIGGSWNIKMIPISSKIWTEFNN